MTIATQLSEPSDITVIIAIASISVLTEIMIWNYELTEVKPDLRTKPLTKFSFLKSIDLSMLK